MAEHTPPTAEELAAMEQRAEAATPGPFHTHDTLIHTQYYDDENRLHHHKIGETISLNGLVAPETAAANADLFASARTDVPRLVAEVERLRGAAVERVEGVPRKPGIYLGRERGGPLTTVVVVNVLGMPESPKGQLWGQVHGQFQRPVSDMNDWTFWKIPERAFTSRRPAKCDGSEAR